MTKIVDCEDYFDKEVYFFMKFRNTAVLIDISNIAHFCLLSPLTFEINSCKTLELQTDWVVDSVYLENQVAMMIILTETETEKDTKVIYFNYYFDTQIMTWYDRPEFTEGKKFLMDLTNQNDMFLFEFQKKGIIVFDLEFRQYYVIEGHKINDARVIEIYLEGHLINRTMVAPLVYGDIINEYENKTIKVVRDSLTKGVYTNLGYQGANINFDYNSDKAIYYFNFQNLDISMCRDVNLWQTVFPGKNIDQAEDLGEFLDVLVDNFGHIFVNTGKEIVHGEFYHDYISFKCTEYNSRIFPIPQEFQFVNEEFISRMDIGSEIIILLKNPTRIFSYNKLINEFFDYQVPSFLQNPEYSDCKVDVSHFNLRPPCCSASKQPKKASNCHIS
jgi:hypothetical protein